MKYKVKVSENHVNIIEGKFNEREITMSANSDKEVSAKVLEIETQNFLNKAYKNQNVLITTVDFENRVVSAEMEDGTKVGIFIYPPEEVTE